MMKQYIKDESRKVNEVVPGDLFVFNYALWYKGQDSMDRIVNKHGNIFEVDSIQRTQTKDGTLSTVTYHKVGQGNTETRNIAEFDMTVVIPKPKPSVITGNVVKLSYSGAALQISQTPETNTIFTRDKYVGLKFVGAADFGAFCNGDDIRQAISLLEQVLEEKGW